MSLRAAIYYAICAQSVAMARRQFRLDETLDSNRDQNGASRRDGFDTDDEARRFLAGVAVRLGSETPPIKFAWAGVSDHLRTDALWMLVERIADASEFVAPNEKSKEPNDKPKG